MDSSMVQLTCTPCGLPEYSIRHQWNGQAAVTCLTGKQRSSKDQLSEDATSRPNIHRWRIPGGAQKQLRRPVPS